MLERWRQKKLVRRATDKDSEAFAALVRPLLPGLHQVAFYLARDADEARDLAQETCLRAFQSMTDFRSDAPMRPWLHRILRNLFLDKRKSAAVRHEMHAEDDSPSAAGATSSSTSSPLSDLLTDEHRQELTAHIRSLPEPFQEVLVLCDIQELSYAEVCEITGLPLGTVKSRLSRARLMLRERILSASELSADSSRMSKRGRP